HLEADDAGEVLARAREAGVDRVIMVATTLAGARAALELTDRHEGLYASLGIHPHNAGGADADRLDELDALFGHQRAAAVGETGLDYFRDYAPRDAQRRLFEGQLELARKHRKPVVIHTRAADDDTVTVLSAFDGTVV